MKEVFIKYNGYVLCEPMTAFTDLLICLLSLIFYLNINKYHNKESFERKWALFYLWMFISTLIGSIAHGAHYYLSDNLFSIIWMIMNISGIVSTYFSVVATISYANYSEKNHQKTTILITGILVVFILLTLLLNTFNLVKIFAGLGLLYVFSTHMKSYQNGVNGNGKILLGIGISFLTVFIHTSKFSLHKHLNYKDISHIIMIISLFLIFLGIRNINRGKINKGLLI